MSCWRGPVPTQARRAQFEEMAREHGEAFMRSALRLTGNSVEAEDLLQETLIKAYMAFEQFAPGSNFRAWVLRIMANTHISRFRHTQRTPRTVSWEDLSAVSTRPFDPPSSEQGPAQQAMEYMLSEEPGEALAALPEEFRVAVILSDVFELSYREIAELLGVPLGTVRSRIFRGRKLLQEALREYAVERRLI